MYTVYLAYKTNINNCSSCTNHHFNSQCRTMPSCFCSKQRTQPS